MSKLVDKEDIIMSEFNFKSQICTDKIQSECLLALGFKKETADMMYEGMAEGELPRIMPYKTEIYDFMVCRNGGIMGELYMRSELSIIGDNELDFVSIIKRMRDAQKERDSLSSKITFLTEEDTRIRANSIRKTMSLESEVDEYLKKMEDLK